MAATRKSKRKRVRSQAKKRLTNGKVASKSKQPKPAPKVKRAKKTRIAKVKKVRKLPPLKITKAQARDPRKAWNFLRNLGLIKSKRDGRKIKRNDTKIKKQVAKYQDILDGKAKVIPLDKKTASEYKKSGEKVVNDKLVIPVEKGEKVTRRKRVIYKSRKIKGGTYIVVYIPKGPSDLDDFIENMRNDPDIIDLLKRGYKLTIRFSDANGFAWGKNFIPIRGEGIDRAIAEMGEYVSRYESVRAGTAFGALQLVMVKKGFKRPQSKIKKPLRVNKTGRTQYHGYHGTRGKSAFRNMQYHPVTYRNWKDRVNEAMQRYRKTAKGKAATRRANAKRKIVRKKGKKTRRR